jgi:hypothetical protein
MRLLTISNFVPYCPKLLYGITSLCSLYSPNGCINKIKYKCNQQLYAYPAEKELVVRPFSSRQNERKHCKKAHSELIGSRGISLHQAQLVHHNPNNNGEYPPALIAVNFNSQRVVAAFNEMVIRASFQKLVFAMTN